MGKPQDFTIKKLESYYELAWAVVMNNKDKTVLERLYYFFDKLSEGFSGDEKKEARQELLEGIRFIQEVKFMDNLKGADEILTAVTYYIAFKDCGLCVSLTPAHPLEPVVRNYLQKHNYISAPFQLEYDEVLTMNVNLFESAFGRIFRL